MALQHPDGDEIRSIFRSGTILGGCLAGGLLVMAAGGFGGCGGEDDEGGPGPDPVLCAITDVNTGAQTSWLIGADSDMGIRWKHEGSATAVRIDLLKAGDPVVVVVASTPNTDFFPWVAPTTGGQPDGSDFGVRVTALGENGCAGEKTGLTLTDVSGCTLTWTMVPPASIGAGDALTLDWNGNATGGLVDIELWRDGLEAQLVGVVAGAEADDGHFIWSPVDSFNGGTGDFYYLRLSASLVPDCKVETGQFSLFDDQVCRCFIWGFSAGAAFREGQILTLTLEQDFGSGSVNLCLLNGVVPVPGGFIADNVPVSEVYNWVVNDYNLAGGDRTRFRIKAVDAADGHCVGQSDYIWIQ